jgi:hypothetical protein
LSSCSSKNVKITNKQKYNSPCCFVYYRLRVFENRGLRGIFGPMRDEVIGGWRQLHNEGFIICTLHHNVIRSIKSRRIRWAGHAAHVQNNIGIDVEQSVTVSHGFSWLRSDDWSALMKRIISLGAPKPSGNCLTR